MASEMSKLRLLAPWVGEHYGGFPAQMDNMWLAFPCHDVIVITVHSIYGLVQHCGIYSTALHWAIDVSFMTMTS